MNAQHTPGPWSYSAEDKLNSARAFGINRDLGPQAAEGFGVEVATETIAEVCGGCEHAEADARLIAAAPDLLEALQLVIEDSCHIRPLEFKRRLELAHAAIAKATTK